MLVPCLECTPRDDIDANTEKLFKILKQTDMIKKRRTLLEIHQQVEITIGPSLSPGDRAEHSDSVSPTLARDEEDLTAAAAQSFERQHVIGHSLSVSPHTTGADQLGCGMLRHGQPGGFTGAQPPMVVQG